MQPRRELPADAASVSADRWAEIVGVVDRITRWAADRLDVVGLLLVGSCARGAPRPDSDIDLILLVTEPDRYVDQVWTRELGLGEPIRIRSWGAISESRFRTGSGLEVEINVGSPDWARTDPVDAGTYRVVTDAARPLYDPAEILSKVLDACQR